MKEIYNVGDLVRGGFAEAMTVDYGFGIITKKKSHGSNVRSYRIFWSNHDSETWEVERHLILIARAK